MNEETRKKLAQDLPANAVKTRDQAGQKLSYVDGHFAVTRANEVFGHDGWSCAVRSICEVYRGTRPGRDGENVVMVYEAHVAVTALGITREDVGIGQCDASLKALAQGIEKGRKEAVTDGLKRALRTFGASFGLALYDKTQADVGASFRAQEIIAGYDAATDDARLESLRGDVREAWEDLSADDRAALGEARDRAAKRIAKATKSKPPQPDPRDLAPHGIEAPAAPAPLAFATPGLSASEMTAMLATIAQCPTIADLDRERDAMRPDVSTRATKDQRATLRNAAESRRSALTPTEPTPPAPPRGGRKSARNDTATGDATPADAAPSAEALASLARVGDPREYLARKSTYTEIERAVVAHGAHVPGLAAAAIARLEALGEGGDDGNRARLVAAWVSESASRAQRAERTAAQVQRAA